MKTQSGPTNESKLLLHACCAPCSTASIERLHGEFGITGFFYNPNIHPLSEYERRLKETTRFFRLAGIPLIVGTYDTKVWKDKTRNLLEEPEGGERCRICIELRLRVAATYAEENGFDYLGSVLSISPHKDALLINQIGAGILSNSTVRFLHSDFKKRGGFRRSVELSKHYDLYRQDYCGCIASFKERNKRREKQESGE